MNEKKNVVGHYAQLRKITKQYYVQGRSQDFTLEAQKLSAEGATLEAIIKVGIGAPPQPTRGSGGTWCFNAFFGIFEAYRTLLVERTMLLYSIKKALRPNKASFSLKNPPNR